jgi:hypothetical protein
MENLLNKIEEIHQNTPDSIHGIAFGEKIKNGINTNEKSIIYHVIKKIPLSEISEEEKIPEFIEIGSESYKTDVIESPIPQAVSAATDYLQDKQRPIIGGMRISQSHSWNETSANSFSYNVGTLGGFVIDSDSTIVGITNAHIGMIDQVSFAQYNLTGTAYNFKNPKIYKTIYNGGFNGSIDPNILQTVSGSKTFLNRVSEDSIGRVKKYCPLSTTSINYIDAALFTIKPSIQINGSGQYGITDTSGIVFATTAEIDSLAGVNANIDIYSCGQATGPKVGSNKLKISGMAYQGLVNYGYPLNIITFGDLIKIAYADTITNPTAPIQGGDSGSILIGNFAGINKIIGLVFAANSSSAPYFGLACRIDRIANYFGITYWNGSSPTYLPENPNILSIMRPISDSRPYIDYNGIRYWQAGAEKSVEDITNI